MQGKATIGDITLFQIYAMLLIQPVWQLVNSVSQTQRSLAAMERVFEVLSMSSDKPDAPDAVDAPDVVREIGFENVNFAYRSDVEVIRDFNLSVPGGATVALVGPSGAGKTTITDLVARFYDPTSGIIRLNGIELRKIRLHSYRQMLAVVQQEVFLFDGTVRENIAYGLRGASDEQIVDAAKRANAHEFIDRLPEGYDTLIGERGFKLSGGQRQRLSIARAILANPKILILDEATSNLDTESEQLIQQSLAELFEGRTTFVIAHRLSTITHADLIVVIDGGRIIETGRHDQLMQTRGLYFEMVERQRRSMGVNGEILDLPENAVESSADAGV
jgi:ATP-binding cassette, subfamily B, bacterial